MKILFTKKKKKDSRITFLLSLLFITILTSYGVITYAGVLGNYSSGFSFQNGSSKIIRPSYDHGKYGAGYKIINNSGHDHFIPTKYESEFDSLKKYPPNGIEILEVVDGGWSGWYYDSWSSCSKSCGGGYKYRTARRYCNNPYPENGGKYCSGSSTRSESASCNTHSCGKWVDISGKWSFNSLKDVPCQKVCEFVGLRSSSDANGHVCRSKYSYGGRNYDSFGINSIIAYGSDDAHYEPACCKHFDCSQVKKVDINYNSLEWAGYYLTECYCK